LLGEERRRELTLERIILHHNKNFRGARPKRERNGKNRSHDYSTLAWTVHYKGIRNGDA
jgi:hypothetical protein